MSGDGEHDDTGDGGNPGDEPGLIVGWDMAPGGPRALDHGCLCSVLANAAYRARADVDPFVDPRCPVHDASAPTS